VYYLPLKLTYAMRTLRNSGKYFVIFTLRGTSLSMIDIYFFGVNYSLNKSAYCLVFNFFISEVFDKSSQTFFLTEKCIPFKIEK